MLYFNTAVGHWTRQSLLKIWIQGGASGRWERRKKAQGVEVGHKLGAASNQKPHLTNGQRRAFASLTTSFVVRRS